MSAGWKALVSAEAVEFLSTLPARDRRQLLDFIGSLVEHPSLQGEHVEHDELGRPQQVKRFSRWVITF